MTYTMVRVEELTYNDDGELDTQHIASERPVGVYQEDVDLVRKALSTLSSFATAKASADAALAAFERLVGDEPSALRTYTDENVQAHCPDRPVVRLRDTFQSPYDQFAPERIGQSFTVIDSRIWDPGMGDDAMILFRIRFPDGEEIDAWPEEIDADEIWKPPSAKA